LRYVPESGDLAGVCVGQEPPTSDGPAPGVDAAPGSDGPVGGSDAPPTGCGTACEEAGGVCEADVCTIVESGMGPVICPPGHRCDITCDSSGNNACQMGVDCSEAAGCTIRCLDDNACRNARLVCGGDQCDILCQGTRACEMGVSCTASVSCTVDCDGSTACLNGVTCTSATCAIECDGDEACEASGSITCDAAASCTTNCCSGSEACATATCPASGCNQGSTCD